MSFSPEALLQQLAALEQSADSPDRLVIAYSGGLDSTVLLHALAGTREQHRKALLAVHVNHGLHAAADAWAKHCATIAGELGVDCETPVVSVDADSGSGPEGAARDVRYAALATVVQAGDWLLSAHHRDDQAETLLLNLLRGSGPGGLAAMPTIRRFGDGWLARPLLGVTRAALLAYARAHELEWVDDSSNDDDRYDRNFLRHTVMPELSRRWPHAREKLARSAALAGEAAGLLRELADLDAAALGVAAGRIPVAGLAALTPPRQNNLLRRAVESLGLPAPGSVHLEAIAGQLMTARPDAEPLVSWPGAEARRYRGCVYLLPAQRAATFVEGARLDSSGVPIGPGLGRLRLAPDAAEGLSRAVLAAGLTVHRRKGGEEIKPIGQRHTKKLKKLLQEKSVVPWMRDQLPLVFAGDELVAVADLWVAAAAVAKGGPGIDWDGRPALF